MTLSLRHLSKSYVVGKSVLNDIMGSQLTFSQDRLNAYRDATQSAYQPAGAANAPGPDFY